MRTLMQRPRRNDISVDASGCARAAGLRTAPMHSLNLPAGAHARLTAAARPDIAPHRWDLRVVSAADGLTKQAFGSEIGGLDRDQRVDIPAQATACRLELAVGHDTLLGWRSDRATLLQDDPGCLEVGYCDPEAHNAKADDLVLSLWFTPVVVTLEA